MKINDKLYELLKWICLTAIPAIIIFLNTCLPLWGVDPHTCTVVVTTLAAIAELIGALIAVSHYNYYKGITEE